MTPIEENPCLDENLDFSENVHRKNNCDKVRDSKFSNDTFFRAPPESASLLNPPPFATISYLKT